MEYLDFNCVKREYAPVLKPQKIERVHAMPEKLKETQIKVLRQPETLIARGLFTTVGEMFIYYFALIFHGVLEIVSSLFEWDED